MLHASSASKYCKKFLFKVDRVLLSTIQLVWIAYDTNKWWFLTDSRFSVRRSVSRQPKILGKVPIKFQVFLDDFHSKRQDIFQNS